MQQTINLIDASASVIGTRIAGPHQARENRHGRFGPARKRLGWRLGLWLMTSAVIPAAPAFAQSCEGPRLQGSTIRLTAQANDIDAEGTVGSSSKSSFLGLFGKKKSVHDMPAVLEVGVVSMSCNAVVIGSQININANANRIRLRNGTIRLGGLVMNGP